MGSEGGGLLVKGGWLWTVGEDLERVVKKRRTVFKAGEEGSEVAVLVCKCQGSLDVAICLQATHAT